MHPVLQFSPYVACLPVVHASGDFAVQVRRTLLAEKFDWVAVPLPESFRASIRAGIDQLPQISVAVQEEGADRWSEDAAPAAASYVPIDPCQPVIAALRVAEQERLRSAFIDLEVECFEPQAAISPDPYALQRLSPEQFAAAMLPVSLPPRADQHRRRLMFQAARLRELHDRRVRTLFVCSLADWVWVREEFLRGREPAGIEAEIEEPQLYGVEPATLTFLLGELPYITGLYEQARAELDSDENLSVDGVKELLLTTRRAYQVELKNRGRKISSQLLSTFLKYVRNLSLIERRMTPDLYTLITAAQQLAGDMFAISLAETARTYPYPAAQGLDALQMSIDRAQLPDGRIVEMKNRLAGPPLEWRTCQLNRKPPRLDQENWAMRWNPFRQCSWPPEDVQIERFRTHVKDRALALMGNDLAKTEKFSTSLKDGLDIRETLRNWHTGTLYVKENPPSRGSLDCVIMLFDSPADPREYPWRITWHAEHHDESTLSFFASPFQENLVGPGIAQATYGGAMFLFPPRPVTDVWRDPQFDAAETLEERLLLAACRYSRERHIALLSTAGPGVAWRRIAKRSGRKLVHVPLAHFSQETVQQLRMFHVLNGQQVRSYAEHFIRKA